MKKRLIDEANKIVGKFQLDGFRGNSAGTVASALITKDGNIYTGICISMACGIGFCAEASAVAEMLKNRETKIEMIVAVSNEGKIIPPCGRCRELLAQVDKDNLSTKIVVDDGEIKTLKEIFPDIWIDKF
ncbi:MAG: cytidine deaminase [Lactobacillaceae bacterium]|jgi:cytidine deaminase|nr:cytidine deaminase [Lactobacillaceae bacterium]